MVSPISRTYLSLLRMKTNVSLPSLGGKHSCSLYSTQKFYGHEQNPVQTKESILLLLKSVCTWVHFVKKYFSIHWGKEKEFRISLSRYCILSLFWQQMQNHIPFLFDLYKYHCVFGVKKYVGMPTQLLMLYLVNIDILVKAPNSWFSFSEWKHFSKII